MVATGRLPVRPVRALGTGLVVGMASSVQYAVSPEPGLHFSPRVLRHVRAKTLPVIGEETMARARVDLEFRGFPGGFQFLLHRLDLIGRYSGVLGAVKAKHRRLDLGCEFKGILRHGRARRIHEASVKGDTRLEARIMRRVEPHAPATPAKANDPEPARISTLCRGPIDSSIEIGKKLAIRFAVGERHH